MVLNDFRCPACGRVVEDVECRKPEDAPECEMCGGVAMKKQFRINLATSGVGDSYRGTFDTREPSDRWIKGPMKSKPDRKRAKYHMECNGVEDANHHTKRVHAMGGIVK